MISWSQEPDDNNIAHRPEVISKIASALSIALYTVVVLLLASTFHILFRSSNSRDGFTKMRRFLFALTTSMFCFTTVSLITTLLVNFSYPGDILGVYSSGAYPVSSRRWSSVLVIGHCCITAVIWATDWFMIWRCVNLYRGSSKSLQIFGLLISILMVLLSFVIGLTYTVHIGNVKPSFPLFSVVTLSVNLISTCLIIGRLVYHRHRLHKTFGQDHRSPYMKIIILFTESASLIVIFNTVLVFFAIFTAGHHEYMLILMQIIIYFYVISCFLIIFKVAYDRAYPTTTYRTRDAQGVVDRDMRGLEFASPADSTLSSQIGGVYSDPATSNHSRS